jgi:NNP family nitrate/nitrite transporter-like MFS transporter
MAAPRPLNTGTTPPEQDEGGRHRTRRWIEHWEPEDERFWDSTGRRVARRNLIFSIFAEHLGFSMWLLWSVVSVSLVKAGFHFSTDQLFWLVALPNLVGSFMRLPYTAAVAKFGGRNWTVVSALLLFIPTTLMAFCVSNPDTPYWMFLVAAATAGVGGGNFASSMANISYFYPERKKGAALGLNAAGGNLGVSVVQLLVPIIIGVGIGVQLKFAAYFWMPFIALAAFCAWRFMDNLTVGKARLRDQLVIAKRKHTWVMSVLYIGTFGSFIGYSAAFPLLIKTQFPDVTGASLAFLGALVGSLSRPIGGWLSDKVGGARVTAINFVAMGLGVLGVWQAVRAENFAAYLTSFLLLFVTTGVGNGSTYRMIPAIFRAQAVKGVDRADEPAYAAALLAGRREAAAVLGFAGAIGAFGGFLIARGFGTSITQTGGVGFALACFAGFYGLCLMLTWWFYLRQRVLAARAPSLVMAQV